MSRLDCGECGAEATVPYAIVDVDTIDRDVPRFEPCQECGARVSGWQVTPDGPEPTDWLTARQVRRSEREYRRQLISAERRDLYR